MIWNKAWKVTFSPPASENIYCNSNYDLEWRTARFILVWKTTRVMHVHATWSGPQKIPSNNMISIFANFHHSQKRKVSLSLQVPHSHHIQDTAQHIELHWTSGQQSQRHVNALPQPKQIIQSEIYDPSVHCQVKWTGKKRHWQPWANFILLLMMHFVIKC